MLILLHTTVILLSSTVCINAANAAVLSIPPLQVTAMGRSVMLAIFAAVSIHISPKFLFCFE